MSCLCRLLLGENDRTDLRSLLRAYSKERVPEGMGLTDLNLLTRSRSKWPILFMVHEMVRSKFLRQPTLMEYLTTPSYTYQDILQRRAQIILIFFTNKNHLFLLFVISYRSWVSDGVTRTETIRKAFMKLVDEADGLASSE